MSQIGGTFHGFHSGTILSSGYGFIPNSGYGLSSGAIGSGGFENRCFRCQELITGGMNTITVRGISGLTLYYHWHCAGFDYESFLDNQGNGFVTREDYIENYILSSVPLTSGSPRAIVADWCEDHLRLKDAEFLRSLE